MRRCAASTSTTGGNEVVVVSDLDCGEAGASQAGTYGRVYSIPCNVPANKSISVRIQATIGADTADVAVVTDESCVAIKDVGVATTYGANGAASAGTSHATGTDAQPATWTNIATTSGDHNLWWVGYDSLGDTSILTGGVLVEFGYGAGTTSPATSLGLICAFKHNAQEVIGGPFPARPFHAVIPSGTKIWVRAAEDASENRGLIVYGANGTIITEGGGLVSGLVGPGPLVQLGV